MTAAAATSRAWCELSRALTHSIRQRPQPELDPLDAQAILDIAEAHELDPAAVLEWLRARRGRLPLGQRDAWRRHPVVRWRLLNGWSWRTLEKRVPMRRRWLRLLARGQHPRLDRFRQLAAALGISTYKLAAHWSEFNRRPVVPGVQTKVAIERDLISYISLKGESHDRQLAAG